MDIQVYRPHICLQTPQLSTIHCDVCVNIVTSYGLWALTYFRNQHSKRCTNIQQNVLWKSTPIYADKDKFNGLNWVTVME